MTGETKCVGCGSFLQSENKDEIGYTPNLEAELCKRCFRLKMYNETPDSLLTNADFLRILDDIALEDAMNVLILDVFDMHGTNLDIIHKKLKGKDTLIVVNKLDLLPKSVNKTRLLHWVKDNLQTGNLNVLDYIIISAHKKYNIDTLIKKINEHRKNRNVYVLGTTNTGKSTTINAIIDAVTGKTNKTITTSYYAGTTLATIEIPLDNKTAIIDTPGIINSKQLSQLLSVDSLKIINLKNEVRPIGFQLNPEQTLFITGLVQFNFLAGSRTSFTVYASNNINIHRTKLENAEELREKHWGTSLFQMPINEEVTKINEFETHKLTIKSAKTDIVIDGLGWITINTLKEPVDLELIIPKSVGLSTRKSII
ncbi:MAG: ribosome biogenesis GTPase YqeH [Mycoplasmatales bacterium]